MRRTRRWKSRRGITNKEGTDSVLRRQMLQELDGLLGRVERKGSHQLTREGQGRGR